MAQYRKKPVVIDAVQLRWDTWSEMCAHANVGKLGEQRPQGCYVDENGAALPEGRTSDRMGLLIPTLEGIMLGVQDDFIIKGVQGELYPCKPEIFEMTYEKVIEE